MPGVLLLTSWTSLSAKEITPPSNTTINRVTAVIQKTSFILVEQNHSNPKGF